MSSIRMSCIWAFEDEFGKGRGSGEEWRAPPPGSYISSSHSRNVNKITAEGTKIFETYSFGTVSGSFEWSFVLDYDYLDPLLLVYEDYSYSGGVHSFSKKNNMRVPSFCIRRKILNRMAGGPDGSDEIVELKGCVAKSISFSMSAGSSQVSVTISGVYTDEKMYCGDLATTDYQEYEGDLVEFACLFVGEAECGNYVANTDSLSLSFDNSVSIVYSTCTPFGAEYSEGQTSYTFGTSCYSNNPANYKRRVYSGGYRNTDLHPQSKNLAPIPLLTVASYSLAMKDGYGDTVEEAIEASDKTAIFSIYDCVIKSLTWQKGDGSKLQDQISSTDCRYINLKVKNGQGDLRNDPPHTVTSTPTTI